MKQPEQNDPLWKLLGNATQVEPGPYFTRRVLREVRDLEANPAPGWFGRLARFPAPLSLKAALPVTFAAAAAVAVALILMPGNEDAGVSETASSIHPGLVLQIGEESVDPAAEMEAVEYLGQLMAIADPGQLSDDALADLFF